MLICRVLDNYGGKHSVIHEIQIKMCNELKYLLQKLKYNNSNTQYIILKNISSLMQNATRLDLLYLLDIMKTKRDIELQIRMVSMCCVYLLANDEYIDIFITSNFIYASMENILSKKLPGKTSVVLNFLTLLVRADYVVYAARKLCLVTHARNMIRTSGCLATMTDSFIRGMMYQDTWKALCHCLAETCYNCEINQSYCTHLIPKCVQICSQGNMDAPRLLFSLLHKHERNIQMFVQTNGMSLFSRNSLQYCLYLQLLDAVVQTSTQAAIIAQKSRIFVYVHEILKSHGPYSQVGQWATVILYHADSATRENKQINRNIETEIANDTNKKDSSIDNKPRGDNTTKLFHNIIKEIIQWQPTTNNAHNSVMVQNKTRSYREWNKIGNDQKDLLFDNHRQFQKPMNEGNVTSFVIPPNLKSQEIRDDDHTFSFLQQEWGENSMFNEQNNFVWMNTTKKINSNDSLYDFNQKIGTVHTYRDITRQPSICHLKYGQDNISLVSIKHFQPGLMSTPKKKVYKSQERIGERTRINELNILKIKHRRASKLNANKKQKPIVNNKLKNKSLSYRLFSAINDSCITVVNRVKNIFKSNKDNSFDSKSAIISQSKSNVKQGDICNYSFTKYMQDRDARLFENRNLSKDNLTRKNVSGVTITNTCKTCDDTRELKQKMTNNKQLKNTIQKLKLGINLYGCDFKKISDVMWPQESYMTSKVLYNLYRKLIRK